MSFYQRWVLPRLVDLACGAGPAMRQRAKVVPLARGRVLELGAGSGLNLPLYAPDRVSGVWALEPSPEMRARARPRLLGLGVDVEFIEASAENIPLRSDSVDTVLVTYTLCTIPEIGAALEEVRRVLKPGGRLVFCEHGLAPDMPVQRWQNRLNPLWRRIGGGCNLNRPIPDLIEKGGFRAERLEAAYIPGWKPGSFNYWGVALPR